MARHYLDHASTTPLRPEARAAMAAWADLGITADPGRVHTEGRMVRAALEDARDRVAALFGVRPRQVVLTSGGTEAVNAAVWGVLAASRRSRPGRLRRRRALGGARCIGPPRHPVVDIGVDRLGRITPAAVDDALERAWPSTGGRRRSCTARRPTTRWARSRTSTRWWRLCRERGVTVHVDAVAAAGHLPLDLDALGADLVSVSSHKLGGPAGVGALILRRGLRIEPLLVGGEQERGRRAGLENVAGAIGFGAAAARAGRARSDRRRGRVPPAAAPTGCRPPPPRSTAFAPSATPTVGFPTSCASGSRAWRPSRSSSGSTRPGVAVHSGSSCSSESLEPSPVLEAMGVDGERSLRLSVGWSTDDADVDAFVAAFPGVVERLRSLRP